MREAPHFGSLTVQLSEGLYPEHPAAGKLLRFSSLLLEAAQNAATAAVAKLKELQAKSAKSKNRFEFSDEDRAYAAAESALESAEEQIEEAGGEGAAAAPAQEEAEPQEERRAEGAEQRHGCWLVSK